MSETDEDTVREDIDAIVRVLKETLAQAERGQAIMVKREVRRVLPKYEETATITIEVMP